MKAKTFLTAASEALLAALLAWSGVMCLVSGFDLAPKLWVLPLWSLFWAGAAVCCCRWKRGWILAAVLAVAVGWWFAGAGAALSLEALVNRISQAYDAVYGWGTVAWSGRNLANTDITAGLCLCGWVIAVAVGIKLAKGCSGYLAPALAAVPLAVCVVLKDTVPEEIFLFLWLLGILLLLMTQSLRTLDGVQAAKLTAMLALPCAAILGLLFLAFPQDQYDMQQGAQILEDRVVQLLQAFSAPEGGSDGDQSHLVQLQDAGPMLRDRRAVMQVVPGRDGVLYLRGRGFSRYDGKDWSVGEDGDTPESWRESWGEGQAQQVLIATKTAHSVVYLPYPCSEEALLERMEQGAVYNESGSCIYKLPQMPRRSYDPLWEEWALPEDYGWDPAQNGYTDIPYETCRRAEAYLLDLGIRPGEKYQTVAQVWRTANRIGAFVRGSARYDLNTPRMPEGEDFALWFLDRGETGYCTHFASAAAVLLRAAGIPARFVTGYMVEGVAGQSATVRMEDAHAWVEYYLPGAGWQLLEATASAALPLPEITAPTQETRQEQTRPSETETVTAPTAEAKPSPKPRKEPLPMGFWALMGALGFGAVIFQWRLRLWLVGRKLERAAPNEKALLLWRQLSLAEKQRGAEPDKTLRDIALKARFSQHSVTEEELAALERGMEDAVAALKEKSLPKRLLYRLLYALY